MRGERNSKPYAGNSKPGSSPHARGTPDEFDHDADLNRFIPACAGNAPRMPRRPTRSPVHPRMRGERWWAATKMQPKTGSSPHARGTHLPLMQHDFRCRFIPACAGNALTGHLSRAVRPVHPRMRGERRMSGCSLQGSSGSSPHARGTPCDHDGSIAAGRFIPACAGNASSQGPQSTS